MRLADGGGLFYVELGKNGEFSLIMNSICAFIPTLRELSPAIDGLPIIRLRSVHFEVDRPAHLHPYIDDCPVCGCTGEYAQYGRSGGSQSRARI